MFVARAMFAEMPRFKGISRSNRSDLVAVFFLLRSVKSGWLVVANLCQPQPTLHGVALLVKQETTELWSQPRREPGGPEVVAGVVGRR